jgi:WD40 repeat protein
MKNLQAWYFLVSRNQYLDYRTIVAPSFICESKASSLLARAAEGDLTEQDMAFYREIRNSKVGDLTLVFRVMEATAEDTGIEGDGVLKDTFGREIYLIEGVVSKGIQPDIVVTKENFKEIHKQLVEHYREFWQCTTSQTAIPSEPLSVKTDNASEDCLIYNRIEAYYAGTQPQIQQIQTEQKKPVRISQSWKNLATRDYSEEILVALYSSNSSYTVVQYDKMIQIFNHHNNKEDTLSLGRKLYGDCLTPIAISPNGKLLASGSIENFERNIVKVWDIRSKNIIFEFEGHQRFLSGRIHALAFSPDNESLISSGEDKIIYIWDVVRGGELAKINRHYSSIKALALSPNGSFIASGDTNGIIKIWNLKTKQEIHSINAHLRLVNSLGWSPDGKILVSCSHDRSIKLWNPKQGEEICTLGQHSKPVNSVTFSPDGQLIASGSDDNKIKVWDVQTRSSVAVLDGHTKEVTSVAFSPDGQSLLSGSKDKTVRYWQRL